MPSIEENRFRWGSAYPWPDNGDEWSAGWGEVNMQWHWTILPRISRFLPADTVLEIGAGYGRWTQFLVGLCKRLIVVDLTPECIEACRQRFASQQHISYYVNDGQSLEMVADNTIDFVFSFDALVHAETDQIEAYLSHLSTKLRSDGVGFIHHSNLGEYRPYFSLMRRIARGRLKRLLRRCHLTDPDDYWRAASMTAEKFHGLANAAGLECISQEIIDWNSPLLIDCISVIAKRNSRWSRPNRIVRNNNFMKEARIVCGLAELYGERLPEAVNRLPRNNMVNCR